MCVSLWQQWITMLISEFLWKVPAIISRVCYSLLTCSWKSRNRSNSIDHTGGKNCEWKKERKKERQKERIAETDACGHESWPLLLFSHGNVGMKCCSQQLQGCSMCLSVCACDNIFLIANFCPFCSQSVQSDLIHELIHE